MKTSKLAELSEEELRREQVSLQEQIFRLRFQIQTGNAENPSKLRTTRRSLARVMTLIREQELGLAGRHNRAESRTHARKESEAK